jgi:hypothetical protein
MGRVDSDLMYDKVVKWDWGNSGDTEIYHDTETRKNSITYRGNLARLVEQLIIEDKLTKAEEVADIAMDNMPVEQFGYYTLLEPYIGAYYEVGSDEKAQKIFKDVSKKYQENLTYYSTLDVESQYRLIEDILTDIERYKGILDVLQEYDKAFYKDETVIFTNYLNLFSHFYDGVEMETEPEVNPDLMQEEELDSLLLELNN